MSLLGVDQSVTLLGTGNDIDKPRLTADMKLFSHDFFGASDTSKKYTEFLDSNAFIITNAQTGNYGCTHMRSGQIDNANLDDQDESGIEETNDESAKGSTTQIRNYFPETWIFDVYSMDSTKKIMKVKVPDTITTFTVRGFSIHPTHGLAISKQAKIVVKKDFFIKLYMPYSIRIGEILKVDVSVFNYLADKKSVKATVKIFHNNEDFELVQLNSGCKFSTLEPGDKTNQVEVPKGNGKSVHFLIRSKKIGAIKIKVHASASGHSDTVEKYVVVKAEGYKKIENKAFLIDLRKITKKNYFTEIDEIALPRNKSLYRENSVEISSSVIGEMLGPSIKLSNIPNLL